MPERVTKRRAEAFKRIHGTFPDNYNPGITDTKFLLGRNKRMKTPLKFLGLTHYPQSMSE